MDDAGQWTSSIAVADLDGDQFPEIVEVNYVDDPLIFQRMCEGKKLDCTPQRFRAACDRIYRSVGDGSFRSWSGAKEIEQLPNYGFGVVIANFDGRDGNDVFISNDGDLNHYWRSVPAADNAPERFQLTVSAGIAGCSLELGDKSGLHGYRLGRFRPQRANRPCHHQLPQRAAESISAERIGIFR